MDRLLELSYKGDRNYLHGSDFYNKLMDIAEEMTGETGSFISKLTFRRYATKQCRLSTSKPEDSDKVTGQVRYYNPVSQKHTDFWFVETDNRVIEKYPFNEKIVLSECKIDLDSRSVVLPSRSPYTVIEDVIILTKYLNNSVSPLKDAKWLFGQLDLKEPLVNNYDSLEIQLKNLFEKKFSVNSIIVNGQLIGSIRFIVSTK